MTDGTAPRSPYPAPRLLFHQPRRKPPPLLRLERHPAERQPRSSGVGPHDDDDDDDADEEEITEYEGDYDTDIRILCSAQGRAQGAPERV